ncbi:MAG: winged helix-turn-helix transcriptional regulator, partial [Actinomycetia bacterium]|nr:winged helix-turn-helix transcriptional regulator [Actinomycetes bacterium]MCP5032280.1 winged helix-turn-helix transcriptional regulator [Actinomycetes bacterium]
GDDWIGDPRTVDVHVRQLRRKLGEDLPLVTVRGFGYRLG